MSPPGCRLVVFLFPGHSLASCSHHSLLCTTSNTYTELFDFADFFQNETYLKIYLKRSVIEMWPNENIYIGYGAVKVW